VAMRDEIFAAHRQAFEPFPAFGQDDTTLRVMSGAERDAYEGGRIEVKGRDSFRLNHNNLRARFVVLVLGDRDGKRVFADEDAPAVGRLDGRELDRIFDAGMKLNRMDRAGDEDLRKNSDLEAGGASTSGSPSASAAPLTNCCAG
jgi:hypothetical protein